MRTFQNTQDMDDPWQFLTHDPSVEFTDLQEYEYQVYQSNILFESAVLVLWVPLLRKRILKDRWMSIQLKYLLLSASLFICLRPALFPLFDLNLDPVRQLSLTPAFSICCDSVCTAPLRRASWYPPKRFEYRSSYWRSINAIFRLSTSSRAYHSINPIVLY